MSINVTAVQQMLHTYGLDGWLLYDFQGSNPIATRLAELKPGAHMTTRRWYYLIPAEGQPQGLVHAIERCNLDALPGEKKLYSGREQLDTELSSLLTGLKRVAMEYSPSCEIPYLSRVDAGTAEAIRTYGIEIVSSENLVQQFEATWTTTQLASHQAASKALYRIKDRTFDAVRKTLKDKLPVSEYDIQQMMLGWFDEEGLVSDSAPVVACGENSGNPHYLPTATQTKPIEPNSVLLLDLWGKNRTLGSVFADITWVGYTGQQVPEVYIRAFDVIAKGRDTAISLVQDSVKNNRELCGWEVDRATRDMMIKAGYIDHILHRTGHSLGETVHGNGVHLDDYETHDSRRIVAGTGFTIEPGLYFKDFGVRTEINMFCSENEATVTGPKQSEIVTLS
tara:strand:+ start:628 stop:1809 length:1182 start_codon:yes stop_codon:yes gene_type:complete